VKRKSKAYNEQQRNASFREEQTTPSETKMKKNTLSLNQISKNETDSW
jgi:hypothetical protein